MQERHATLARDGNRVSGALHIGAAVFFVGQIEPRRRGAVDQQVVLARIVEPEPGARDDLDDLRVLDSAPGSTAGRGGTPPSLPRTSGLRWTSALTR